LVAALEVQGYLKIRDLSSVRHRLQAMQAQVLAQAGADPSNTTWHRDLSVSHDALGGVATRRVTHSSFRGFAEVRCHASGNPG